MKLPQLQPRAPWVLWGVLIVAAVASGFYLGNYSLHRQLGEMQASHLLLREEVSELLQHKEQLLGRQVEEERQLQVMHQAMRHLQEMLLKREAELQEVRSDVDLYRKLMQSDIKQEVEIHALRLKPGEASGSWNYQLVLYQKQSDKQVQGQYDLVFYGRQEDREVQHRLSELIPQQEAREFSFRYFERLGGTFSLPSGLEVRSLEVEVSPIGKRIKPMRRLFEWRKLLAKAAS